MGWWQPVGQRSRPLIEGLPVQVPGLTSQKVDKVELHVQMSGYVLRRMSKLSRSAEKIYLKQISCISTPPNVLV